MSVLPTMEVAHRPAVILKAHTHAHVGQDSPYIQMESYAKVKYKSTLIIVKSEYLHWAS